MSDVYYTDGGSGCPWKQQVEGRGQRHRNLRIPQPLLTAPALSQLRFAGVLGVVELGDLSPQDCPSVGPAGVIASETPSLM